MKCPACNNEIPYGKICPYCKKDIILTKKIIDLSNTFYNHALTFTKNNELSFAIICLKKSLCLYKNNTNARNLLGLIFYRMGRIGDALKHWVISQTLTKGINLANDYLMSAQQNPKILDKYNDSIKFYNLGLNYINQNNDDMGVIQLKKSLEINPDFIDALNLLALCYIYQDEKDKAQKLIERVLQIDNSNIIANNYYKRYIDKKNLQSKNFFTTKIKFIDMFNFSRAVIFLSGIFFGIIIIYALVFPAQISSKNKSIEKLQKELDVIQENYDTINEEMPKLKKENEQLTKDNIEFQQKLLENETQKLLTQAQDLYSQKKIIQATDILYGLSPVKSEELSEQIEKLRKKVYPSAAKIYYDKGLQAYNSKNFEQAKENFEKALLFSENPEKINYYLEKMKSE